MSQLPTTSIPSIDNFIEDNCTDIASHIKNSGCSKVYHQRDKSSYIHYHFDKSGFNKLENLYLLGPSLLTCKYLFPTTYTQKSVNKNIDVCAINCHAYSFGFNTWYNLQVTFSNHKNLKRDLDQGKLNEDSIKNYLKSSVPRNLQSIKEQVEESVDDLLNSFTKTQLSQLRFKEVDIEQFKFVTQLPNKIPDGTIAFYTKLNLNGVTWELTHTAAYTSVQNKPCIIEGWASKLGQQELVLHSLKDIEGSSYGYVAFYALPSFYNACLEGVSETCSKPLEYSNELPLVSQDNSAFICVCET